MDHVIRGHGGTSDVVGESHSFADGILSQAESGEGKYKMNSVSALEIGFVLPGVAPTVQCSGFFGPGPGLGLMWAGVISPERPSRESS